MSRIVFNAQKREAEVHGTERYRFAEHICNISFAPLKVHAKEYANELSVLRQILTVEYDGSVESLGSYHERQKYQSYQSSHRKFSEVFELFWRVEEVSTRGIRVVTDELRQLFIIKLDTAYQLGSDVIKLMARIHGQCEMHGWVSGSNRAWLASIIQTGLKQKLFTADCGWQQVIELLLESDTSEVVMSHTVTDDFPNIHLVYPKPLQLDSGVQSTGGGSSDTNERWYGTTRRELYNALSGAERWNMAMDAIRLEDSGRKYSRELTPETWCDYEFGGYTAMNIISDLLNNANESGS